MKRILALVAMFWSVGAMADGNQLLNWCQSAVNDYDNKKLLDPLSNGMCYGTILGTLDTLVFINDAELTSPLVCTPKGIRSIQLARVVNKFLLENPVNLNIDAGALVTVAMMKAYPCSD